jgi:uridine phosphorylase
MTAISKTDLILNPDGSVYHLRLLPGDIANTILLVGDPGRASMVSAMFESVDVKKSNREFITFTGTFKGNRVSVISTGIGTDNIDIVLNELDALVNVDLTTRLPMTHMQKLTLVRIGTSGALHADILPGTTIVTEVAGGFDGLYHFYQDNRGVNVPGLAEAFIGFTGWSKKKADPYFIRGSDRLLNLLSTAGDYSGITVSTPGFYAPQNRSIRLAPDDGKLIHKLSAFSFTGLRICNFEMESSALYALSSLLGHEAVTLCLVIANRVTSTFLEDYHPSMEQLISEVLDKLFRDETSGK